MIWIIGADNIIKRVDQLVNASWSGYLHRQLTHVEWEGCHFYDLIAPMFLFVTGCSMVFSFNKRVLRDGILKTYRHVLLRVFVLWIFGMFAEGLHSESDWYHLVFFSDILQAIAISYLFASLILLINSSRLQILTTLCLLAGYTCLMHLVPVPGEEAGNFTKEGNLAAWIDARVVFFHDYGYTCLLTIMTWTVSVMIGCFAGQYLKSSAANNAQPRFEHFLLAGGGLLALGFIMTPFDPCIKRMWTASYTLISGGACLILFACLFYIIDVRKYRRWSAPLVAVGANSLLAYVVFSYGRIIDPEKVLTSGFSWLEQFLAPVFTLACSIAGFTLMVCLFVWLYRRRIFVSV